MKKSKMLSIRPQVGISRLSMFGLGEVLGIGPEMSDGVGWDGAYCRGRRVCGEYKDYFRERNVRAK